MLALAFTHQQDTYVLLSNKLVTFAPLPYPSSKNSLLLHYQLEAGARLGAAKNETRGLSSSSIANLLSLYKENTFNTPIPTFEALPLRPSSFSGSSVSHCQRILVLQLVYTVHTCHDQVHSCVARMRTLTEFHSMSIEPYPIHCYRDGKWVKVQTDRLLPRDVVSLGKCLYSLKGF